jgi:hypothetical protein
MVQALCYKAIGRGYISRLDHSIIFSNLPNTYSRTMTLGFTQHLKKMSTKKYFWQ